MPIGLRATRMGYRRLPIAVMDAVPRLPANAQWAAYVPRLINEPFQETDT